MPYHVLPNEVLRFEQPCRLKNHLFMLDLIEILIYFLS